MKLQVTLKDLVDLIAQIERDEQEPVSKLRSRDRNIGKGISSLKKDPLAQLSGWLDRVNNQGNESLGSRVESTMRIGLLLILCVGLILGWLTSKAVFSYDGSSPVSIIDALLVLVLLQILILLFTCLTFLPNRILRFLPFMSLARETFSLFNPGNLLRVFFRFFPSGYKDPLHSFYGTLKAHRSLYGDVEKWNILRASQAFAVSFNLGALIGFYLLIASRFVAFGWSTTLGINSSMLKAVTDFLSWPWSKVLTNAKPSLALIEATRFSPYDGKLAIPLEASPEIMAMWWSFIFLSLLTYGLLPRLLTLTYSHMALRKLYKHTFLSLPGAKAILDRLNTPLVETASESTEDSTISSEGEGESQPFEGVLKGRSVLVVDWGGTGFSSEHIDSWLKNSLAGTLGLYTEAGGAFPTGHDQKVIESIGLSSSDGSILILVKAWEPPMAEFADFIHDLRQHINKEQHVMIIPVGNGSSTEPLLPDLGYLRVWSSAVKRLGDPWTFIAPTEMYGKEND